jgi:hypothetical protein
MIELGDSSTYNRVLTTESSHGPLSATKLSVIDDSSHSCVVTADERQFGSEKRDATLLSCYANLTSVFLGSGILTVPFAVSDVGWIAGFAALIVGGLISAFTLHILALSALNFDYPSMYLRSPHTIVDCQSF